LKPHIDQSHDPEKGTRIDWRIERDKKPAATPASFVDARAGVIKGIEPSSCGLDPRTHPFLQGFSLQGWMDCRVMPGHARQ
jgi:hypothetical protein